jgi:hypothetical protein
MDSACPARGLKSILSIKIIGIAPETGHQAGRDEASWDEASWDEASWDEASRNEARRNEASRAETRTDEP